MRVFPISLTVKFYKLSPEVILHIGILPLILHDISDATCFHESQCYKILQKFMYSVKYSFFQTFYTEFKLGLPRSDSRHASVELRGPLWPKAFFWLLSALGHHTLSRIRHCQKRNLVVFPACGRNVNVQTQQCDDIFWSPCHSTYMQNWDYLKVTQIPRLSMWKSVCQQVEEKNLSTEILTCSYTWKALHDGFYFY